jgi:hypothetical protein
MKVAQLQEGKTYEDRKGNKRVVRQITKADSLYTPNEVYYAEGGFIHHIPKQDFAAWAKRCVK